MKLSNERKSQLITKLNNVWTWEQLFELMIEWQGEQFPGGTAASGAKHLLKEANELVATPDNIVEWGDALHLIIQGASRTYAGRFPDFFFVVRGKLEENIERDWQEPDADGVVEHIREYDDFPGAEVNPF